MVRHLKSESLFLIFFFIQYCLSGELRTCYYCDKAGCTETVKCAPGIWTCYVTEGKKGDVSFYESDCAPYLMPCGQNIKQFPAEGEGKDKGRFIRSESADPIELDLLYCNVCLTDLCNLSSPLIPRAYFVWLVVFVWFARILLRNN